MKFRTTVLAATLSAFAALAAAGPALADPPWERGDGWHHHRHHRDWDGPRVVYAPPPVVYAAPPVVYEPASPSINFVFPLR